jgi:hypothetical protein
VVEKADTPKFLGKLHQNRHTTRGLSLKHAELLLLVVIGFFLFNMLLRAKLKIHLLKNILLLLMISVPFFIFISCRYNSTKGKTLLGGFPHLSPHYHPSSSTFLQGTHLMLQFYQVIQQRLAENFENKMKYFEVKTWTCHLKF